MKNLRLLWKFMEGNRTLYTLAILSVGLATVFSLIRPLVLRVVIDSIIGDTPLQAPEWVKDLVSTLGGKETLARNLWIAAILIVIFTLLNGIFLYLKGKWSAIGAEATAMKIREKLYDHLQHLPFDYHVKAETGDLIQRCTSDVDTIRRFLSFQLVEIGRVIFMIGSILPFMLVLDAKMTLISMAAVPLIFLFAMLFFIKVKKAFQVSDEAEGSLSTVLQENLTGVRVVRAFARQAYEIAKFETKNRDYKNLTYRLIVLLGWYWSISDFLCLTQIAAVLILGVYWASVGRITLGTLVVFITYEGMLLWPVRQMGRILTDMGKALVSLERIKEILDEKPEEHELAYVPGIMHTTAFKPWIAGNVEFKDVCFGYDAKRPILKDITFSVRKGQTVALLGPTGSGKSTLMLLLARLYDYQSGSITIDGNELKNMDKKWVRENVGIVLQEPFLFSKTIKENIGIAKMDADDEEIFEVAKIAAVHDVIEGFDKGYESPVGERGVTLSGGQKQRIAIARTLVKNCPILILDDSLSAVDTETDAAIRKALKSRTSRATTFIISHRITTLAEADMILVLEDGEITQKGTHAELINQTGLYNRIWTLQNSVSEGTKIGNEKHSFSGL
ncbi:ABC transporter ATP-binding protein [bacterium]|nr:ABC transporter ATP-binding protein [bacterium]